MATFEPFRALLYPAEADPALVTSPPYDVIPEAERRRLADLDPHNIVRIILPEELPGDQPGANRYTRAAADLRAWLAAGVLVRDTQARFYAYRMDYTIAGTPRTTDGVIGALTLEPLGSVGIFGHEKTMPKPRGDRLELMRATRANLEPIWLIGGSGIIGPLVGAAAVRPALVDVVDPDGVRHRLWPLDEQESQALGGLHEPLVIADGHHRYGASLELRDDLRATEGLGPWDATLALISDPTLEPPALLAIHRLVDLTLEQLARQVQLTAFDGDLHALLRHVEEAGPGTVGVALGSGCWTTRAAPPPGEPDTVWLVTQILAPTQAQPTYVHDEGELADRIAAGGMALILAPVPIPMVVDTALNGRVMPPKSTLFWPKPRTGMLVRDFDGT